MKISDEKRVVLARRKLQGALLNENCSVNINPSNFRDENVLPVAVVEIPALSDLSAINSKIYDIVGEFNLAGWGRKSGDNEGFIVSLHLRKPDNQEPLKIRHVLEDIFSKFKKNKVS